MKEENTIPSHSPATSVALLRVPVVAPFAGRRFTHPRFKGVALWIAGHVQVWEPWTSLELDDEGVECEVDSGEGEFADDPDRVRVVMVGDDHRYDVDLDELTEIDEDAYCPVCGQLGCFHGRPSS